MDELKEKLGKFKEISVAHGVLSDQASRARYDRGEDFSQQAYKRESSWEKEMRKFCEKADEIEKGIHKLKKRRLKYIAEMNRIESFNGIRNIFFYKCEKLRKEREEKVDKVIELNSEVGKDEWIEELTKSVTKLKNDKGNYISLPLS